MCCQHKSKAELLTIPDDRPMMEVSLGQELEGWSIDRTAKHLRPCLLEFIPPSVIEDSCTSQRSMSYPMLNFRLIMLYDMGRMPCLSDAKDVPISVLSKQGVPRGDIYLFFLDRHQ